jgi:hypothetical protein
VGRCRVSKHNLVVLLDYDAVKYFPENFVTFFAFPQRLFRMLDYLIFLFQLFSLFFQFLVYFQPFFYSGNRERPGCNFN